MELLLNLFKFAVCSIVFIAEGKSSQLFKKIALDWNHQQQAKWYDNYKDCSLSEQSPIEINAGDSIIAFFIPPLQLHNYNVTCTKAGQITNTGHTVEMALSKECPIRPQLSGGPLPYNASYEAVSFHFHWGSKYTHGSEHIIDSKRHSMEGHIVHRNMKYSTLDEALKHRDGLVVLAIFYDAEATTKARFNGLQYIVKSLKAISKFNTTTDVKGLRLDALMGDIDTSRFYTYQGSLTTPPCSQVVTWIVFPQAIDITQAQMKQFRILSTPQGEVLVNNYRFLQPKGIRKVYYRSDMMLQKGTPTVGSPQNKPPATPGPLDEEVNLDFDYDV